MPLLLRVSKHITGRELYREAAKRVSRLVKADAREKLNNGSAMDLLPPVPPMEDPCSGREVPINGQDAHAGSVPAYGFRLREVSSDGMGDPKSHWLSRSIGHLILPNDEPAGLEDGSCIAIDWHLAILKV
jgi:hypothetical protein